MSGNEDLLQPVTEAVRRQAKGLVRSERFGTLSWLQRGGAPGASLVSLATTLAGHPILLLSRLAPHVAALEADDRVALLIGQPGKGDPLAHPRLMLSGRALPAAGAAEGLARSRFLARHPKAALYADFADFAFWTVAPTAAALNGGFGKASHLGPADIACAVPAGLAEAEPGAVAHMNTDHADAVQLYAGKLLGVQGGPWRLTGLDAEGLDLAAGDLSRRLWFETPLQRSAELRPRLIELAQAARQG